MERPAAERCLGSGEGSYSMERILLCHSFLKNAVVSTELMTNVFHDCGMIFDLVVLLELDDWILTVADWPWWLG